MCALCVCAGEQDDLIDWVGCEKCLKWYHSTGGWKFMREERE